MDPLIGDLRTADVLLEDSLISKVAPSIEVQQGWELIDATGMVVMPGLTDPHRHLWYTTLRGASMDSVFPDTVRTLWPSVGARYSPTDLYAATQLGIADALNSGITTIFDWCHVINSPDHADAAIEACIGAPLRVVFGYGASRRQTAEQRAGSDHAQYARVVQKRLSDGAASCVQVALALDGPFLDQMDITKRDIAAAREMGVHMSFHVGAPEGPTAARAIMRLADMDLLGPDMNFVHCCNTTDEEFRAVASAGATVTAAPGAELATGIGHPSTGRMRKAGLRPSFAADAVNVASGDLFDQARLGLLFERSIHQRQVFDRGEALSDASQLGMTAREALEAITINAAHACWRGDVAGSVTPGKQADLILLRATDLNLAPLGDVIGSVVVGAQASNVDTVLVGGVVVKRNGRLLGIDVDQRRANVIASRDRLFAESGYAGIVPA